MSHDDVCDLYVLSVRKIGHHPKSLGHCPCCRDPTQTAANADFNVLRHVLAHRQTDFVLKERARSLQTNKTLKPLSAVHWDAVFDDSPPCVLARIAGLRPVLLATAGWATTAATAAIDNGVPCYRPLFASIVRSYA